MICMCYDTMWRRAREKLLWINSMLDILGWWRFSDSTAVAEGMSSPLTNNDAPGVTNDAATTWVDVHFMTICI